MSTISTLLQAQIDIVGRAAKVICDVGSHTEQTTLEYLDHFPQSRVYAFEPDATNFAALRTAIAGHQQQCAVHNIALSASDGVAEFHVNSHSGTHSLLPIGAQQFWAGPAHEVRKVTVQTQTLESFAAENMVSFIAGAGGRCFDAADGALDRGMRDRAQ